MDLGTRWFRGSFDRPTKRHQARNSLFRGNRINMTVRTFGPDGGKENKVMDSFVQRWLIGRDSWSAIKKKRSKYPPVQR